MLTCKSFEQGNMLDGYLYCKKTGRLIPTETEMCVGSLTYAVYGNMGKYLVFGIDRGECRGPEYWKVTMYLERCREDIPRYIPIHCIFFATEQEARTFFKDAAAGAGLAKAFVNDMQKNQGR